MNYIYWFDTAPANGAEYINLCRRMNSPVILRYCSLQPESYQESVDALRNTLEHAPETLNAVVVNAPLDQTARIYRLVAGRVPVLSRITANPFRVSHLEEVTYSSHFRGSWLHIADVVLEGDCLPADPTPRTMVWFSANELTARQETELRRIYGQLTIIRCSQADDRFYSLLERADLWSSDIPASWLPSLCKQTSAKYLYPVHDETGGFAGWRAARELTLRSDILPRFYPQSQTA